MDTALVCGERAVGMERVSGVQSLVKCCDERHTEGESTAHACFPRLLTPGDIGDIWPGVEGSVRVSDLCHSQVCTWKVEACARKGRSR